MSERRDGRFDSNRVSGTGCTDDITKSSFSHEYVEVRNLSDLTSKTKSEDFQTLP